MNVFPGYKRRRSVGVKVGSITIGGDHPVVVQSMTNTDTADAVATARQIQQLAAAGSELVRITVNTEEAAEQVPRIRDRLDAVGCKVPLIGDFHYNGHLLLTRYPSCAEALAKYRINPGNVGFGRKRDAQFATMIEVAIARDKPVRIGVNWGSLDQTLVVKMMDENARSANPRSPKRSLGKPSSNRPSSARQKPRRLGLRETVSYCPARSAGCRTSLRCTTRWPVAATTRCTSD